MTALRKSTPDLNKAAFEKVVVITRKTELEELVSRFNTLPQAQFYLEHAGQDFTPIAARHARYQSVLDAVRNEIPGGLKSQVIDRSFLPQFTFGEADLVVTVGPDGLVVNVAKYLNGQPILAVNPDPSWIDGLLLPFAAREFSAALHRTLQRRQPVQSVTMAEARLSDGQTLVAFNDLFIGARSHVSARYGIAQEDRHETHSSSGIIVSTGAGSTGWLQSVYAGAAAAVASLGGQWAPPIDGGRLPLDADYLVYAVREPFPSKATQTSLAFGTIDGKTPLTLNSHMADNGVIFSDGMEADYLTFNAGTQARVGIASRKAYLISRG